MSRAGRGTRIAGALGLTLVLGWLVLAAASMWSLEQDRRRGEARPQPLVPGAGDADPNAGDLLRTAVAAHLNILVCGRMGSGKTTLALDAH